MKKFIVSALIVCSFAFLIPTTHASWFGDVVDFFRGIFFEKPVVEEIFIPEKASDEPSLQELMDEIERKREEESTKKLRESSPAKIPEAEKKDEEVEKTQNITTQEQKDIITIQAEISEETSKESYRENNNEIIVTAVPEDVSFPIEVPATFTCNSIVKTFSPTRKNYFASLPFGSQNHHTEILRYKILWFDGTWSNWFTPGENDKDWQGNRHYWSYFSDHQYQVEHCENYQYNIPH